MTRAAFFPGQGSQAVGMGRSFYDADAKIRALFERADQVLGFSLSKLCFDGPLEELTLTKFAQPAILTASYASWLMAEVSDVVVGAGHSLGEYSALVAAGSLTFDDAVLLVHKRGQYMQEAVALGAGKMIAVMGPTEEEISAAMASVEVGMKEIANLNCPGQTVVAGDVAGVDALSRELTKRGAKIIPLNVSAPFHCQLMKPAADMLAKDLDVVEIKSPTFPIIANFTAAPVTSADQVRQALKDQVCGSVRWTDSVRRIIADYAPSEAIEFGPGAVLTKLAKRIDKSLPVRDVFDVDSLVKLRAA